ncbi:hypothetical protein AncyloWKF20_13660 [Ancylobacter sp. WKF20]|uniref:hypothetical protein n=1 Tax=Ancylobacter sp. WKF20 TaxID=3039801 RepID=UPI0024341A3B|nr:hypothetical protein [Ancylobacter sp. WKF20]WGD28836.1 hypothetical protein AncyloWKF20_13660 [Ancylobacter sp. WKF20]
MNALTPFKPAPAAHVRQLASVEMPRPLPFLLNVLLAGALGYHLGGWMAALAGAGALLVVLGGFLLAPQIGQARRALERVGRSVWVMLRPLVGLVLFPPVAAITLVLSVLLLVGGRVGARINRPAVPGSLSALATLRAWRHLLLGLFTSVNLPMTAVNILLLVVLGCVGIGIEVAFYAALAAVPVMIVALVMVAIEASREPEDGPAAG